MSHTGPCKELYSQLDHIDEALKQLRLGGVLPTNPAYQAVWKLRGELMGKLGFKTPRGIVGVLKLLALSPGSIQVWFDAEAGWVSEARAGPGAPPVYRYIDAATAVTIIKGGLTHELEAKLMEPDSYIGE